MVFSITTYPFTGHYSPYVPAINKMPSYCVMAKECNTFSFELHSNLHWNGDVFNQRFVISPRTRVLHACLSPKWQNLTTLASGKNWFLFRICLKDYNLVWLQGRLNWRLNYIIQFLISVIEPKCQPFFNWYLSSTLPKLALCNHLRKISLQLSFHIMCWACGDKQPW